MLAMANWVHVLRFCDMTLTPHCYLVLGPQYMLFKASSVGGSIDAGLSVVVASTKQSSFSEQRFLVFFTMHEKDKSPCGI